MPHFSKLFKSAALPLGKTMYVYGGGWNKADNGAGKEARSIGVSPKWETFFKKQDKDYNYKNYLYQIHNGLDCSGYIGFCLYNTFETKNGNQGYVTKAREMGLFLENKGYGHYTEKENIQNYLPGDIMCSHDHVYMVLGECEDKSVLIIHSSPNGVQVNGTVTPQNLYENSSMAQFFADNFMKKYFPGWYEKHPPTIRDNTYLEKFGQFRWHNQNNIFTGISNIYNMNANQILDLLIKP